MYNTAQAHPYDETFQWVRAMWFNWMAGWLASQAIHWNAGSFVCLREEWVRGRMPLMIA